MNSALKTQKFTEKSQTTVSVQFPEKKSLPNVSANVLTSGTNLRKAERLQTTGNMNLNRLLVVVVFGLGLYLILPTLSGHLGFPLDDAWIHQTYARNLAATGRWEYAPGVVSAGSTSPLWTTLLAIGYALGLPHLLWAYLWGGIALFLLAWGGMRLWQAIWPEKSQQATVIGLVLALTWQLVFAAASGMESALFIALTLHLSAAYSQWRRDPLPSFNAPLWIGLACGTLILLRPDGLGLVALIGAGIILRPNGIQERLRLLLVWVTAAALPLVPYFAFNLAASGHIWPNTFYAKQAEYAILLSQPLWQRIPQLFFFSLGGPESGWRGISGAHLLLLPGLIVATSRAIRSDWRQRRLLCLLPVLWAAGLVLLYALRLPVTYQRGRYLWPALPIWIIYGLAGWQIILNTATSQRLGPLTHRAIQWTFALLLLVFLVLGGLAYQTDVAFIEGEMVQVAHWLQDNTDENAIIAAHDIGAIGYFAPRPLLDLAGLISPDIVPYLQNEADLATYIRASNATYLVTAPGWPYASLTTDVTPLYITDYAWTTGQGVNNMAVYPLRPHP